MAAVARRRSGSHGTPRCIVAYADLSSSDLERLPVADLESPDVRGTRQIPNVHPDPFHDYVGPFHSRAGSAAGGLSTPPGAGLGQKPEPHYLKPGDVVRLGIEKLGEQQRTFMARERVR